MQPTNWRTLFVSAYARSSAPNLVNTFLHSNECEFAYLLAIRFGKSLRDSRRIASQTWHQKGIAT